MPSSPHQESENNYETTHVHEVYEAIAPHFSSTRYKPWPIVTTFLQSQPAGSIGLDVGCGNGKYLLLNPDIFVIASDRSNNLVRIASQHQPHSCVVADNLNLPHHKGVFDFAISIAVIHHLSTRERRVQAVASMLETLRRPTRDREDGGRALIFVWALEQKNSRRGWDKGDEQDVMVPWVMKQEAGSDTNTKIYERFYHLYREGELEEDVIATGGMVVESGYDRDNWWTIATPKAED